jgi:exodeoxyribonuclease-3
MIRVVSANLNGIRSATTKGFLEWLPALNADFVCTQELKAQPADLTAPMMNPASMVGYFHCAEKKGYSGVGIYARKQPLQIIEGLGVPEIDVEGRYIELVYEKLSVISVYLPSGSSGDLRQTAKFAFMAHFFKHLTDLAKCGREVILCGDWNIAHKEIDLKNWKGNIKNSGFLPEERLWLTQVFDELKWVDVYRGLFPDTSGEAYTWWSNRGQARAKNVGWRIDYQIATADIAARAKHAYVYKDERFSDHAPLVVDYDWS